MAIGSILFVVVVAVVADDDEDVVVVATNRLVLDFRYYAVKICHCTLSSVYVRYMVFIYLYIAPYRVHIVDLISISTEVVSEDDAIK